jgi:hypothetical protein
MQRPGSRRPPRSWTGAGTRRCLPRFYMYWHVCYPHTRINATAPAGLHGARESTGSPYSRGEPGTEAVQPIRMSLFIVNHHS